MMTRVLLAVLILGATISPLPAQTKKLLVIGIDGLRPDALAVANAPHMHNLIANGCYSAIAQSEDLTFSGPNWSTILHGVHRDKHQVVNNNYSPNNLTQYPDLFARLEQHNPAWNTYRLMTWISSHIGQPSGADVQLFRDYNSNGDELITREAEQILSRRTLAYPLDPDAVFVMYQDVDVVGHTHGFHPSVQAYLAEIADTDTKIGRLLSAIQSRPQYAGENWLIILTSDHGGSIDGSHAGNTPEKRAIPFLVSGTSAARGVPFPEPKNVDLVKTALAFMEVPINPSWGLDGHVVGLSPSSTPEVKFGRNLIFNGDGEYDRGFRSALPDQSISGWDDPGPDRMTVIQYGSPGGWPTHSDPGPPNRGSNFFCGGGSPLSEIKQSIDLSTLASAIDAGAGRYDLSAFLGGWTSQNDRASFTARFFHPNGAQLGSATLGPVTAANRNNQTGLLPRQTSGTIPAGTRHAQVLLSAQREGGSDNDGYADNLSLVVWHAADLNRNGCVDDEDLLRILFSFGMTGTRPEDVNGDGVVNDDDLLLTLLGFGC